MLAGEGGRKPGKEKRSKRGFPNSVYKPTQVLGLLWSCTGMYKHSKGSEN